MNTDAKFEVATPYGLGGETFTRKYIFWPWVKVTWNVAQYPLHYLTYMYRYTAAKFEVATSNGLGRDAFTRKYIIWTLTLRSRSQKMLTSTLYIMWPMQLQNLKLLRQMNWEENTITRNRMHVRTHILDARTTDGRTCRCKINIPFYLKKKVGINNCVHTKKQF